MSDGVIQNPQRQKSGITSQNIDVMGDAMVKGKMLAEFSSSQLATPLRELTCRMGSHSVTCHPAEVTFPPLPQPKLVLD